MTEVRLATVYFIELSDAQIAEINAGGWGCETGRDYLAAKDGVNLDSTLYVKAAAVWARDAEEVWTTLQNVHESWVSHPMTTCFTRRPRSMDVGDYIVWPDGSRELCAAIGFEKV